MYMFLYLLASQGDPILEKLLEEVGESVNVVNPAGRRFVGGRPSSSSTKRGRAREDHILDSIMFEDPVNPTRQREEERKKRILEDAEKALSVASLVSIPPRSAIPEPLPTLDPPSGNPEPLPTLDPPFGNPEPLPALDPLPGDAEPLPSFDEVQLLPLLPVDDTAIMYAEWGFDE